MITSFIEINIEFCFQSLYEIAMGANENLACVLQRKWGYSDFLTY